MLFRDITVLDTDFTPQPHQYVGISGDTITYLGSEPPLQEFGEVYEGCGKLLMSGFFNSHGHTPMTLLRGYGENLCLADWLNTRIFPFEACLTPEDIYYGTLLGIAEMLQYGTVSVTDMYYSGPQMAQAFLESGMKCNLGLGTTAFQGQGFYELPRYQEYQELFAAYHNAGNGRLLIDTSIHGEYTSNPRLVQEMAAYTQEKQAHCHLHLSETKAEHDECLARHGKTPTQYFYDLGVFASPTTAAHGVWITPADIALLAEKNVTVASCPISNLKLASGICPVPQLLQAGVNVALGTDSAASNNNLNMIEEMKVFALIQKGWHQDPTLIRPAEAIYAATRAGALAQGRQNCGLVQQGFQADLIVLDCNRPNMQPCYDWSNNLVYAADGSQVCLTMVDGKTLYRDGQFPTLDLAKIQAAALQSHQRILGELANK